MNVLRRSSSMPRSLWLDQAFHGQPSIGIRMDTCNVCSFCRWPGLSLIIIAIEQCHCRYGIIARTSFRSLSLLKRFKEKLANKMQQQIINFTFLISLPCSIMMLNFRAFSKSHSILAAFGWWKFQPEFTVHGWNSLFTLSQIPPNFSKRTGPFFWNLMPIFITTRSLLDLYPVLIIYPINFNYKTFCFSI